MSHESRVPSLVHRARKSMAKNGVTGFLVKGVRDAVLAARSAIIVRQNFKGRFRFVDRRRGRERMLVVLAGYKPYLWGSVFPRLATHCAEDIDVCVASAGVYVPELARLCERYGWSYLATRRNRIGLTLNIAIKLHSAARWIYKMDEDIFATDGVFRRLEAAYRRVRDSGLAHPGFCAPLLNINGYSYRILLERTGRLDEFKAEFGCGGYFAPHEVFKDPQAAVWVWKNSLPLDACARQMADAGEETSFAPIRFSIGLILLERSFWEKLGGFRSGAVSGILGLDEEHLCKECIDRFRPMVIVHDALAGHFSFYPQESAMRSAWDELSRLDPACMAPRMQAD